MDTDLIMMMMVATFQLTPIPMPMTGNMELTIHGTPLMEMTTLGTTPGITHTEWEMDQVHGNMGMDLNMTTMDVTLPLTPTQMLTTGSTETTTPGITPMELIIHGTMQPTTLGTWETDQEATTGLTQVIQLILHT